MLGSIKQELLHHVEGGSETGNSRSARTVSLRSYENVVNHLLTTYYDNRNLGHGRPDHVASKTLETSPYRIQGRHTHKDVALWGVFIPKSRTSTFYYKVYTPTSNNTHATAIRTNRIALSMDSLVMSIKSTAR